MDVTEPCLIIGFGDIRSAKSPEFRQSFDTMVCVIKSCYVHHCCDHPLKKGWPSHFHGLGSIGIFWIPKSNVLDLTILFVRRTPDNTSNWSS